MYFLFLLLWIVLNGQFTWEIFGFGLVIAAVLYGFICQFMDYHYERDILFFRKIPYMVQYILVLLWEIVKANVGTIHMVLSFKEEIDPVIVKFRTDLQSPTLRVVLANSITLTPGTITVMLEEDMLVVHALDAEFAKHLDSCVFIGLLHRMENLDEKYNSRRRGGRNE